MDKEENLTGFDAEVTYCSYERDCAVFKKLSEYEKTGKSPAEIKTLKAENSENKEELKSLEGLCRANISAWKTSDEMHKKQIADLTTQLKQAETALKNSVQLPCKVGDTVWVCFTYYGKDETEDICEKGTVDSIMYFNDFKRYADNCKPQLTYIVSGNSFCIKCSWEDERVFIGENAKAEAKKRLLELRV